MPWMNLPPGLSIRSFSVQVKGILFLIRAGQLRPRGSPFVESTSGGLKVHLCRPPLPGLQWLLASLPLPFAKRPPSLLN